MFQQFTPTSKLEKVLCKLRLNEQTSTESSVGFLLLALEEVNLTSQTRNYIDKLCRWLKLALVIDQWEWIYKLEQLEEILNEGRHFGSPKWKEEIRINRTLKRVKFCNLIMIDPDYFSSEEYKRVFRFKGDKDSIV